MKTLDSLSDTTVDRFLRGVRRWGLVVVAITALGALGAGLYASQQTKQYTATASLLFNNSQLTEALAGVQVANNLDPQGQIDTNEALVQSGSVAARTATAVGHGFTARSLMQTLKISEDSDTNLILVSAITPSPHLSALIANTYSEEFIKQQNGLGSKLIAKAQRVVQRQLSQMSPAQQSGAAGVALQDREQSLDVLQTLEGQNVQLAKRAVEPVAPSSPKKTEDVILGGLLALLVSLAVVLLADMLDKRIRDPKELEAIYGEPVLAVVPESPEYSAARAAKEAPDGVHSEVFRLLRAHLRYFNVNQDLSVLMVASASVGDGKSTVAYQLARAASASGDRAILVECDLRRPNVSERLSLGTISGLAEVLIGAVSPDEAITQLQAPDQDRGPGRLDVLTAGVVPPPNPAQLIESESMGRLLRDLRSRYDLVVIDTPPLTVVSDAIPLISKVDGVVIVSRVGRNRRDVASRLRDTLVGAQATVLGIVANGVRPRDSAGYGYTPGYGYTDASRESPPVASASSQQ